MECLKYFRYIKLFQVENIKNVMDLNKWAHVKGM